VIAVLIEQLLALDKAVDGLTTVPGSERLHQNVFNRI
jgi:hypothetical protein